MATKQYNGKIRPEYRIWQQMKARCTSPTHPQFKSYGAKGATVCEVWLHDPAAFMRDMGPRPSDQYSLRRRDETAPYCPSNCYWRQHRHGFASIKTRTPEYAAWHSMKVRCFDPKMPAYKNYGGRGITVCERWARSFPLFLADIGLRPSPQHSLDRYPNNDGDYEPGNVRWATRKQQEANKRKFFAKKANGASSRFRGVIRDRRHGHWFAYFKNRYLGTFLEEVDAATAYNFAAYARFGNAAIFNSPDQAAPSPAPAPRDLTELRESA